MIQPAPPMPLFSSIPLRSLRSPWSPRSSRRWWIPIAGRTRRAGAQRLHAKPHRHVQWQM